MAFRCFFFTDKGAPQVARWGRQSLVVRRDRRTRLRDVVQEVPDL